METLIQKRIEELESKRDKFIVQANLEVAAYNGAIQELRRLLKSLTPQSPLASPAVSTSIAQVPHSFTTVTPIKHACEG